MANVNEQSGDGSVERVLKIKRCAAVVKGGRRFSFAALVVVGNGKGHVGYGYGKANEVPPSVQKAQKQANRDVIDVPLVDGSMAPDNKKLELALLLLPPISRQLHQIHHGRFYHSSGGCSSYSWRCVG